MSFQGESQNLTCFFVIARQFERSENNEAIQDSAKSQNLMQKLPTPLNPPPQGRGNKIAESATTSSLRGSLSEAKTTKQSTKNNHMDCHDSATQNLAMTGFFRTRFCVSHTFRRISRQKFHRISTKPLTALSSAKSLSFYQS
ncbi:hypothetical protein [Helicobacter sp. 23-1045]